MGLKGKINKVIHSTLFSNTDNQNSAEDLEIPDYKTSNKDAKICHIGLGRQGLKIATALLHMGYNVVGVCDLVEEKIQKFNSMFPKTFSTTKIDDFSGLNADVAVVATLADNKLAIIKKLSSMNIRRTLCEKPIVNTMSDLYELYEIAEKKNLNVKVNHPKLWAPDHWDVKKILTDKKLGNVKRVEIHFKPNGFGNIGCHLLALAFFLLDSRIRSAESAYFESIPPKIVRAQGHHDLNGKAILLLDDDVELSINNLDCKPNRQPRVILHLEHGIIDIRIQSNTYHVFDRRDHIEKEYSHVHPWGGYKRHKKTMYHLIDLAITDLLENKIDNNLQYAGDAVEAIIAAQLCFEGKQKIRLPLDKSTKTPYLFS